MEPISITFDDARPSFSDLVLRQLLSLILGRSGAAAHVRRGFTDDAQSPNADIRPYSDNESSADIL